MCRVLTIYKVGRVGLHGEIKTVWLAGFDGNIRGSFVEITDWLKRCILVDRNTDGVVIGSMDWRSENKWRNGERKNTERYPTSETARQ